MAPKGIEHPSGYPVFSPYYPLSPPSVSPVTPRYRPLFSFLDFLLFSDPPPSAFLPVVPSPPPPLLLSSANFFFFPRWFFSSVGRQALFARRPSGVLLSPFFTFPTNRFSQFWEAPETFTGTWVMDTLLVFRPPKHPNRPCRPFPPLFFPATCACCKVFLVFTLLASSSLLIWFFRTV